MYIDYYIMGVILLPAILFTIYAQYKVTNAYKEYSQYNSESNIKACDFARRILDNANLNDIQIIRVSGTMTDYYDHKNKTVALSSDIYDSTSIAALGIAAHEVGHALQYKSNYAPIKIRNVLIPACNFASRMLWPLIIMGLIFNFGAMNPSVGNIFLYSGVIVFGLSVLVNLITLPSEYNASNRAKKLLVATNTLTEDEIDGASVVLNSAALTYVAALLTSLLNLLRFILVFRNRD